MITMYVAIYMLYYGYELWWIMIHLFASFEKIALLITIQIPVYIYNNSNIIFSMHFFSSEVKLLNQFISASNDGFEPMMSECDIGKGWLEPMNLPEFSKNISHIISGLLIFWLRIALEWQHRNPILMIQAVAVNCPRCSPPSLWPLLRTSCRIVKPQEQPLHQTAGPLVLQLQL